MSGVISGFTLRQIFADILSFDAIFCISKSSSLDSILNCCTLFFKANSISYFSLPTPEKIIFSGLIPAAIHFLNSPIETMSAPAPNFPK